MPARKLSDPYVRSLKCPEDKVAMTLTDAGGGLAIWVSRAGSKVWRYHYRFAKRAAPERIIIGKWPEITYAEARQTANSYDRLRAEGRDPKHAAFKPATAPTVREVLDHHVGGLREDTGRNVRNLYKDILGAHGDTLVRDFSRALLRDWIDAHYAQRRGSAANLLRNLTAAFNKAERDLTLCADFKNPAAKLRSDLRIFDDHMSGSYAVAWVPEDWAKMNRGLAAAYADPSVGDVGVMVIELLMLTGARPSEITTLRWDEIEHIDLGGRQRTRIIKERHKTWERTGRPKRIVLGAGACAVIEKARDLRGRTGYTGPYVFPQRRTQSNQRREHVHQLTHYTAKIAALSGLPFTPYNLRSAYINHALDSRSATLEEVAENVGHTDTRTTLAYYRRLREERLADAAEAADQAFQALRAA